MTSASERRSARLRARATLGAPRAKLPAAIVLLGATSLFTDVASDMIMPLLPLFLGEMTRQPGLVLGFVEGAAETTASFLKLAAGRLADRTARKKPLVLFGYALAAFVRPLMGFALTPVHVLTIRLLDRLGKGVRTAPRDAIIAAAALPGQVGRAFGFHRAMDHAGAVIGPLLATALLAVGWSVRDVFFAAALPGALALLCALALREPEAPPRATSTARPTPSAAPSPALRRYLMILTLFALGNPSDTFLILRAKSVGMTDATIPVLWGALHVSKMIAAWLGGALSDRLPRVRVVTLGWAVNALAFALLGWVQTAWQMWTVVLFYGVYHGLAEPAEKALIKDLADESARGSAFGSYHFVTGISAVPAGLGMGALWDYAGPQVAFGVSAGLSLSAALALMRARPLFARAPEDPLRRVT